MSTVTGSEFGSAEAAIEVARDTGATSINLSNMGLTALPDTIWSLTSIVGLDLTHNNFTALPKRIAELHNLRYLYIWANPITYLSPELSNLLHLNALALSLWQFDNSYSIIEKLSNLRSLWILKSGEYNTLSNNLWNLITLENLSLVQFNFTEFPTEIQNLSRLKTLNISGNRLSKLPIEICRLSKLETLDISNNQISFLPAEIEELSQLRSLNANENPFITLPAELGALIKLQTLNINNGHHLRTLPIEIGQLNSLHSLGINGNQLQEIPAQIWQLTQLQSLFSGFNGLQNLPAELGHLTQLRSLSVSWNQLKSLPKEIGLLKQLQELYIHGNQLTKLPRELGELTNLQRLDSESNKISVLPYELTHLDKLSHLNLRDNPLNLPPEILKDSLNPRAILDHLSAIYLDHTVPMNEVKVLLVGEAAVGKTSVVRRLIDNDFDPHREATPGINIRDWHMKVNNRDITLHIWDFGGQEILHNTHQLFLTSRSLYLLVLDATANEQEVHVHDWLKTIHLHATDATVIVVINKSDGFHLRLNTTEMHDIHPITAIVEVSCFTGAGIEILRETLKQVLKDLPHLNDPISARWLAVRQRIGSQNRDYVEYREFEQICADEGVKNVSQSIAEILNSLGVLLTYGKKDRQALKLTHILNPNWVTEGIYPILFDETLRKKGGFVTDTDIERILDPERYPPEKQSFILAMMFVFDLAYELGNGRYLVPELLPPDKPLVVTWDDKDAVRFVYQYDFVPPGLFSRFVVQMKEEIESTKVWRTGVILHLRGQPYARVLMRKEIGTIELSIKPPTNSHSDPRTLLDILRDRFEKLHAELSGLKVEEHVPIVLSGKTIAYKDLLELESFLIQESISEGKTIETHFVAGFGKINVAQILNGIATPESRQRRIAQHVNTRFDAHSFELSSIPTQKIVAFFAKPFDRHQLAQREEYRYLQEILPRDQFNVVAPPVATADDLQNILRDEQPQIIYISGHGDKIGLVLEDQTGEAGQTVNWNLIANLLQRTYLDSVASVIINTCYAAEVRNYLPIDLPFTLITQQGEIPDKAMALVYMKTLFEWLKSGKSLPEAHNAACWKLQSNGCKEDLPIITLGKQPEQ